MSQPIPFNLVELYHYVLNKARAERAIPTRWRFSESHLKYGERLTELLGLPVYYAMDTNPSAVILETHQGDFVELLGFSEEA